MPALARPAGRHQLVILKGDKLGAGGGTILRQEGGAIKSHTDLLVDQVGPESTGKCSLDEEDILSIEGRWCYLSVCGGIDACGIDNLTYF